MAPDEARRLEGLRRLGVTVCEQCRRAIAVSGRFCPACYDHQAREARRLTVARRQLEQARALAASRETQLSLQKQLHLPSSRTYREACAAMEPEVEEAVRGWGIGNGF